MSANALVCLVAITHVELVISSTISTKYPTTKGTFQTWETTKVADSTITEQMTIFSSTNNKSVQETPTSGQPTAWSSTTESSNNTELPSNTTLPSNRTESPTNVMTTLMPTTHIPRLGDQCSVDKDCPINYTQCQSLKCQCQDGFYSSVENNTFCLMVSEPDPPKSVNVINRTRTELTLSVDAPDEVRGEVTNFTFYVYSRQYSDMEFMLINSYQLIKKDNQYSFENLATGVFYKFMVFTKNEKFVSKNASIIIVQTKESEPDRVRFGNITEITDTSADINFIRPGNPNGVIIGYRIELRERDTSMKQIFNCNVTDNFGNRPIKCEEEYFHSTTHLYIKELRGEGYGLDLNGLLPFSNYSIVISARTNAGIGEPFDHNFKTLPGAPLQVTNVIVVQTATSAKISWNYGPRLTGITSFSIKVIDEIEKNILKNLSVNENSRGYTIKDLDEYWKYSFEVTAHVKGIHITTSEKSGVVTTSVSNPGSPRRLSKVVTGTECSEQEYFLTWEEPPVRSRNGCIRKYVIRYNGQSFAKEIPCPNPDQYSITRKSFRFPIATVPGKTFTVQIHAELENPQYSSKEKSFVISRVACPDDSLMVALITICVLLLVLMCGFLIFLLVRKYRTGNTEGIDLESMRRRLSTKRKRRNRPFLLANISETIQGLKRNNGEGFRSEFRDLNTLSVKHVATAAQRDENLQYNRYGDIIPYDVSRVRLVSHHTDYINASFIPGYTYEREYIASQGPLQRTVDDFWKMVWEQEVTVIVMLTKCEEDNVDKCYRYWPIETNKTSVCGDIEVMVTTVENNGNLFTVSEFILKAEGKEKRLTHFHFLQWPDFSAAIDPNQMIGFLGCVRRCICPSSGGPMLVHCSAGVGRSGTFISLDFLARFVQEHDLTDEVDIFSWVLKMREHRPKMVQNEKQYIFIHEALREIVRRKQANREIFSEDSITLSNECKEMNSIQYDNQGFEEEEDEEDEYEEEESEEEEEEEELSDESDHSSEEKDPMIDLDQNQSADDIPIIPNEHQTTEL